MDIWEKNLKEHLQKLPKLTSPSLEAKLVSRIAQEKTAYTRHKRIQRFSAVMASLCVVLALGISVPYWWLHRTPITQGGAGQPTAQSTASNRQSSLASNVDWVDSNLNVVSSQIQQVGQDSTRPISAVNPMATVHVQAVLKNISRDQLLWNQNVQGVLFFFKDGQQAASYFVDGPKDPVQPGKTVDWSYDPSPDSWPNTLDNVQMDRVQTKLAFITRTNWVPYSAGQNTQPSASTLTAEIPGLGWRIGASPLVVSGGALTGAGVNHMYMRLTVDVYNPSNLVISQANLMGFVFLPASPGDPVLKDITYKYMVDVPLSGGSIQ
ncbi:MAG: hypothetical protein JWN30_1395, partial [Bacilli bacterium]|nr:hypothetical protein [Bacilli bacterium]